MLIHNKDDIEFVTEFPCIFWDTLKQCGLCPVRDIDQLIASVCIDTDS